MMPAAPTTIVMMSPITIKTAIFLTSDAIIAASWLCACACVSLSVRLTAYAAICSMQFFAYNTAPAPSSITKTNTIFVPNFVFPISMCLLFCFSAVLHL